MELTLIAGLRLRRAVLGTLLTANHPLSVADVVRGFWEGIVPSQFLGRISPGPLSWWSRQALRIVRLQYPIRGLLVGAH